MDVPSTDYGRVIEIPLTQGFVARINECDSELIGRFSWYCRRPHGRHTVYARTTINGPEKVRTFDMHRLIMNATSHVQVDHKDGNGLNNTRENLRICTNQQNQFNRRATHATSRFKGVYRSKNRDGWEAKIQINGKQIYLGFFRVEEDAARAYDSMAVELFGEFARLNPSSC